MKPRSCLRQLVGLGLTSVAVTASPVAIAHGGNPRAYEILPEPGNPDHVVLRSYVWGLMQTRDAGQSWQYTCAEVYGGDSVVADAQRGLRSDYIDKQCLPRGGPHAGPVTAASSKSDGGCSVHAGGAGSGALVGVLVALAALGRRRRRYRIFSLPTDHATGDGVLTLSRTQ